MSSMLASTPEDSPVKPVRVLLVEDHDMVAEALGAAFDEVPDVELVERANSLAGALDATRRLSPDVILLDRRMPDGDGIDIIGDLRANAPGTRVLVFTGDASGAILARVIDAGGAGLLLKSGMFEDLLQAIRLVAAGHVMFESGLLTGGSDRPDRRVNDPLLTTREREVLALIAEGTGIEGVARELQLGHSIVRHYVDRIFAKLGVRTEPEAVALARGRGLID
jgi:DNA-binding NarL/FixJ family response regulator